MKGGDGGVDAASGSLSNARAALARELGGIILVLLRVGTLLARSGAAAFRVREAMERAAVSLGVERSEFVIAVDSITASVFDGDEFRTQAVRLPPVGVDMNLLCRIELMTRALADNAAPSPEEIHGKLDALQAAARVYPLWVTVPALGAACAAFCGAGHGTWVQMLVAFGGAALGHLLRLRLLRRRIPLVSVVVACAFASCFASELLSLPLRLLGALPRPAATPGMETLASVLYLIPGVPLVTSLIDLLHGDISCGLSRAAFAAVVVGSISAGMFAFFAVARLFPW